MDDPVLARRSIRAYTAEPVADEQVERLLRAAMAAPSAGNQQPWRFVVVTDRATLAEIPTVHPYSRMLEQAPLAIVVCGVERGPALAAVLGPGLRRGGREHPDRGACSSAWARVWLGVYPLDERVRGLRPLLGIPDEVIPFRRGARRPPRREQGAGRPLRSRAHPPRALVAPWRRPPRTAQRSAGAW